MKLHETAQNEILRLINEKNGLSLTSDDVVFARVLSAPETTSILFKGKDGSRYYKSVFVSLVKRDLAKAFLGIPVKIIIEEDTQLREIMQAVADRYGIAFDLATDFLQGQLNKTTTTSTTGRQSVKVTADEGSLVWAGDLVLTVENRKYNLLSLIQHLDLTGLKYLNDDRTKGDVELLIAGIDPDRFVGLANLQQGEAIYPALAHRIADAIRRENAPEDIGDINNPLSGGDYDLYVEFCNDQLGYSCWNLVNRVKSKYTQIKTGVLPFLPTIMSNAFTEKLNLPKAWYNPEKFDRFYSECYDWIIETHVTKAEQAITIPRDTLGFPVSQIHYYLGFVPGEDLAPLYGFDVKTPYKRELWKRIMGNHANNLDMFEGLTQYIWAYPQFIGDSIIPGQVPEEFYFLGKRYDIIRTDIPFDFTPDA